MKTIGIKFAKVNFSMFITAFAAYESATQS